MKRILLILFSAVFTSGVYAHGSLHADLFGDVSWTPVNVSIFPVHLFFPLETDVRGVYLSPGSVGYCKNLYGITTVR